MGSPSVGAALTRVASISLAVAAAVVLLFTALANCNGGKKPAAAPTRSMSPVPATTEPGSIEIPSEQPTYSRPATRPDQARAGLKALAGKWVGGDGKSNYFLFQANGQGQWVAYGQKIWTGKAMPRNATTFDLSASETSEDSESYWQVKLVSGGKKLYFAGNQETYRKV